MLGRLGNVFYWLSLLISTLFLVGAFYGYFLYHITKQDYEEYLRDYCSSTLVNCAQNAAKDPWEGLAVPVNPTTFSPFNHQPETWKAYYDIYNGKRNQDALLMLCFGIVSFITGKALQYILGGKWSLREFYIKIIL